MVLICEYTGIQLFYVVLIVYFFTGSLTVVL